MFRNWGEFGLLVILLVLGVITLSESQMEEFKSAGNTQYDNHLFNNGQKKVKDSKWENSVLKSKVEVLGELLKKHVQSLRNKPDQRVELVFLVDSSASVGSDNFFNELKFVKKLLADFTVSWYTARVAVVTFSSKTRVVRHIDHIGHSSTEKHKCVLLEEELPNITYTGGGTYTLGAVLEAQAVLEGARSGAAKAVFLVTDGYSNGGDPRPAAQKLRKQGVEIFTFGIRNGNVRELFDMASEPQQEHSFILDSFEEFEALARRALHEDLQTGSYLPQARSACDRLCVERNQCCHNQAECTCGTHTGHYACLCPAGHYGTGLRGDCHPCPGGTFRSTSGPGDVKSCTPCPDINQISEAGSSSASQCYCKRGFLAENGACRMMACPKLDPPENGYFVKNTCHSVFNAACGIRCQSGYKLVGSSIRLCQENGTWSGEDPHCVMRTCGEMKPPKNGRINCTTEEHVIDTECEFSCDVGFSLVGSKRRTCLPIGYWDGLPAFCRAVHCLPMPKLQNGLVQPARCTTGKSKYGEECEFRCEEGYELRGPVIRNCTQTGTWSDEDQKSRCLDTTPPVIICPQNITVSAAENENFAVVDWDAPQATDNSGFSPDLVTLPALERPMRFRIGHNLIKYIAHDRRGNTAECQFAIIVLDTQPPMVDKCESPPVFLSRDRAVEVVWEEPIFSDNSGKNVTVERSHSPGIFPLGDTLVTYKAWDDFGNNSTCTITISIQEHACHLPVDPINGNANCTERSDAVYCSLTCQDGYAFAMRPAQEYFCAYDGQWMPGDNPMPFPDCSVTAHSSTVVQDGIIQLSMESTACEDPFFLNQVETQVKRRIVHKMQEICGDNMVCEVDDLEATCKQLFLEEGELDNELSLSKKKRRKRSLDFPPTTTTAVGDSDLKDPLLPHAPRVDKDRHKTVQVYFQVRSRGQPAEGILLHTMDQVKLALSQAAEQGQLDVSMGGQILPVNQLRFKGDVPQFACEPGSVVQGDSCVLCPVGTFFNVMTEDCEPCTRGSYQPSEGQLTCMVCPNNTSTKVVNAKSSNECKSQCLPGSFSVDGLEKCSTCHVGTYQPEYAHTECVSCPTNTTTWRRAARKIEECKEMCPAGYVSETGLLPCYPCPVGYYQNQMGHKYCLKCPYSGKTASAGTGSANACEYSLEDSDQAEFQQLEPLEINECFSLPCQHGGQCRLLKFGYVCDCRPGFTGMHCETNIDECSSVPCQNNGTCQDAVNSYTCQCALGFTGLNCEINIDDCAYQPCENGASCTDKVHGYMCECAAGYTGTLCEVDIDECLLANPCKNGANCIDLVANVTCACAAGWTSVHCDENIDDCVNEPCQNGAVCEDLVQAYKCVCPAGYSGLNCETDINECDSSPCQEGATCLDLLDAFQCICPPAITGVSCDTKIDQNFVLSFASSGTLDYVALAGLRQDLTQMSICLWMKTYDKFNYGTPFSYATEEEDNVLTITDYSGFVFYVNGEKVITDVTANDGLWHYFCVTWESEEGRWTMYLDAELRDTGKGLANGTSISRNGTVVLGQEQDANGGGFNAAESFVGVLYRVDVWNRVLTEESIAQAMGSCDPKIGNVIAWGDFKNGLHGRVKVEESNFCQGCPVPKVPIYGHVTVRGTLINSVAVYKCEDGYRLSPESNRTCAVHGGWTGEEPNCQRISCGYPGYLVDGQVQGSSYLFGDRVHYVCNNGFSLVGDVKRHCKENGQWSGSAPSCKPIICSAPLTVENGLVFGPQSTYRLGESMTIVCNEGYKLDGVATLKCLEDGSWEDVLPVCQPVSCSQPPKVKYGRLETELDSIEVGTVIQYTCDVGFQLDVPSTLRCSHEGTWIGSGPECLPVVCGDPVTVRHATYVLSDLLRYYGSKLKYRCEPGYDLYGPDELTCDVDAVWQPYAVPACMPVDCGAPLTVPNGQVIVDDQTYGSIAYVECFAGFTLKGEQERVCTASGEWSGQSTSCVELYCTSGTLEHGVVLNSEPVVPGEVLAYQCDQGYELTGPATRLCLENGSANDTEPRCRPTHCAVPAYLSNGTYVHTLANKNELGYFTGDVIEYYCAEGYVLKGTSQRTCTANTYPGTGSVWVPEEEPSCKPVFCPPLDNIDYGSVLVHGFATYQEAEYECRTGFTLEGESHRLCLPNGTWSEEAPVCVEVQCPELESPTNGNVVYTSLTYNSRALYECDEGYVLEGKIPQRLCRDNGQWGGLEPRCVPRTCTVPEIIEHGYIGFEGNLLVGSSIFYDCEEGYELVGVVERVCLGDGTWTEEEPVCNLVYCPDTPQIFPNGVTLGNSSSYRSMLTFQCEPGYALQGDSQSICQASRIWEPAFPTCIRTPCLHPGVVQHAYVSQSEPYLFGDSLEYSCYLNYRLEGVKIKNCSFDGMWVPEGLSECVPIVCPSPAIPMYSQVTIDHPHDAVDGTHFVPETVVNIRCDPGYVLHPESTNQITCTSAGYWNEQFPLCRPVRCPLLPKIPFGQYMGNELAYDTYSGSVSFTCDTGYRLEGSEVLQCTQNGSWSDVPPICIQLECLVPLQLSRHLVLINEQSQYTVGHTLTLGCLPGFTLVGDSVLQCTSSNWSSDFPTCVELACPSPPPLKHGKVNSHNNTAVEVTCDPGYYVQGMSTWYCLLGSWETGYTSCESIKCTQPPGIDHGRVQNSSTAIFFFEYVAEYVCNTGYEPKLKPTSTLICGQDGKWHGRTPECYPVTCPAPSKSDVTNGQYLIRSRSSELYTGDQSYLNQVPDMFFYPQAFQFGDIIEFECNLGYRLVGTSKLECTATATWSSVLPVCELVVCSKPPNITDGMYSITGLQYNDAVTYLCRPGYKIVGATKRSCTEAGTWSDETPFCDPVLCPVPEVPSYAIWQLDGLSVGDTVRFDCQPGYVIVGKATLTCLGTRNWSDPVPTCVRAFCPFPQPVENGDVTIRKWTNDPELAESDTVGANNSIPFRSVASFTCSEKYQRIGPQQIVCQNTGTWSGPVPTCRLKYCSPPVLDQNIPSLSHTNLVEAGQVLNLTCQDGYTLVGPSRLTCLTGGEWNAAVLPFCQKVVCPNIPVLFHSRYYYVIGEAQDHVPGTSIAYYCEQGYTLQGNPGLTCGKDGHWLGYLPVCVQDKCPEPPLVSYSIPYKNGIWPVGAQYRYSCLPGYYLTRSNFLECTAEMEWTGGIPKCLPVNCPQPRAPLNGLLTAVNSTFMGLARYACQTGYKLLGQANRLCQATGTWSGNSPQCQRVWCPELLPPAHGFVMGVARQYGDKVGFLCEVGYSVQGSEFATCNASGQWTPSPPICKPALCQEPPTVHHGVVPGMELRTMGMWLKLECEPGYVQQGNLSVQCLSNQQWSAPFGKCERVWCGRPRVPPGIILLGFSYSFSDRLVIACPPGQKSVGHPVIKCQSNGQWSGPIVCEGSRDCQCRNGGACLPTGACACPPGYSGDRCQNAHCILPCLNGGSCTAPYRCSCRVGYKGLRCEKPTCEPSCANGGRCVAPNTCHCPSGYSNPQCLHKKLSSSWHRG